MPLDSSSFQLSLDEVLDALQQKGFKPKKQGSGWVSLCPGHDDHDPSLSINESSDGKVLLNCFSNQCAYPDIIKALNLWVEPSGLIERKDKDVKPYHVKKGVKLHSPARIDEKNNLIIPFDNGGSQTIYPDGKKRNNRGCDANTAMFFFANNTAEIAQTDRLLVATGYATTASIRESTNAVCVMVMSDTTMQHVIKILRDKYPDKAVTICADYDARNKFIDLAKRYNCKLCYAPALTVNNNDNSDFNDLMLASGKQAVCDVISKAQFVTHSIESKNETTDSVSVVHAKGITGKDLLMKKFESIGWIVPDILPNVGAYLLAGKQKMGKSWFALALALACTQGGKFLNRDIPKTNVLYLGLEDSERRMQSRILTLQPDVDRNPGALDSIRFFHGTDNVPRLDQGFFEFIDPYLNDVGFVVIDILQKIRPMKGSGNVYQDDYNALGALQQFATTRNLCLLILHHTRKAEADDVFDTINGSGGVGGAADGALIITRKRGDGAAVLATTGRDISEIEHGLTFKAGVWAYAGTAEEVRATGEQNEVFNAIAEAGSEGVTVASLCETLGKNEPAVRKLLRKLAEVGRIRKRETKPAPHYAVCDGPLAPPA